MPRLSAVGISGLQAGEDVKVFESNDEDLSFPNSYYNSFEEMYGLSQQDLE